MHAHVLQNLFRLFRKHGAFFLQLRIRPPDELIERFLAVMIPVLRQKMIEKHIHHHRSVMVKTGSQTLLGPFGNRMSIRKMINEPVHEYALLHLRRVFQVLFAFNGVGKKVS